MRTRRGAGNPLRVNLGNQLIRLTLLALLVGGFAEAGPSKPTRFSPAWVEELARVLAKSEYREDAGALPQPLAELTYDAHRDIRFRGGSALWRSSGLPFQVQLFHLGWLFKSPVEINLVTPDRKVQRLAYDPAMFDLGRNSFSPALPANLGFAGFRLHHPLNRPEYFDELVVFLGASYFRSLGRDQLYGLSARGLAIDTAMPRGEEFPRFRSFWLEQPKKGAQEVVVHALLDSPSATGAYRFVIKPGDPTTMRVQATLFARRPIERLGLAPLTSMFLHGENDGEVIPDYRPEVHDSDGLLMWLENGERLWRPVSNPTTLRVTTFQAARPKGFGLMQRDRAFTSYEDLEAHYERRPSAWVDVEEGFGDGAVMLVEIPTREEIHDNLTAFWTPAAPVPAGSSLKVAYRISWGKGPSSLGEAQTVATRIAAGSTPDRRKFVLDFSAPAEPPTGGTSDAGSSPPLDAVVTASAGKLFPAVVQRNGVTGGYRAFFELEPGEAESIELRCFLRRGQDAVSETWSYLWTP